MILCEVSDFWGDDTSLTWCALICWCRPWRKKSSSSSQTTSSSRSVNDISGPHHRALGTKERAPAAFLCCAYTAGKRSTPLQHITAIKSLLRKALSLHRRPTKTAEGRKERLVRGGGQTVKNATTPVFLYGKDLLFPPSAFPYIKRIHCFAHLAVVTRGNALTVRICINSSGRSWQRERPHGVIKYSPTWGRIDRPASCYYSNDLQFSFQRELEGSVYKYRMSSSRGVQVT